MTEPQDENGHSRGPSKGSNAPENPDRFLFTVDGDSARNDLKLACDLVTDNEGELFVGAPVEVAKQTAVDATEPRTRGDRLVGKYTLNAKATCSDTISPIREVVRVGHSRMTMIADMVQTYGITTLIEESIPETGVTSIFAAEFYERNVENTCDVITVSVKSQVKSIDSIAVPISAGPHSGMAIDTAISLARQNDAAVELVHVEEPGAAPEDQIGEQVLNRGIERTGGFDAVTQTLLQAESVSQEIVEYTENFDITVIGAPSEGLLEKFGSGTIPSTVSAQATGTVITTHRAGVESSWLDRWT